MNDFSCCSSCSGMNSERIFSLGSYMPYSPGYGHTFGSMNNVGMAGPLMGKPVARPYPGQIPLPVGSVPAMYDRGEGNPKPYYSLPTFNSFYSSGDPAGFNPLSSFYSSGDPAGFNPLSAYPSPSNPTGSMNPVGESMPAQVGHPYRVGGDAIGGMVTPLGSYFDNEPYNSWSRL